MLTLSALLSLCACSGKETEALQVDPILPGQESVEPVRSTFSIRFLDVGQGDSALVECDGHYMLIDGGEVSAGEKVYSVLAQQGVRKLDILAVSHLHTDHYGGLISGLNDRPEIGMTISNATQTDTATFERFQQVLQSLGTQITVPAAGDRYALGSATVEVIDSCAEEGNDSLVLMVTYGKTRFLFTGDIERSGQLRVVEYFENARIDPSDWVSLIKMPHHGAYNDNSGLSENALYRLFWEYDPSYFVISVGADNQYGHPHRETVKLIEDMVVRAKELDWDGHVYRTDERGDVVVRSDGETLSFGAAQEYNENEGRVPIKDISEPR